MLARVVRSIGKRNKKENQFLSIILKIHLMMYWNLEWVLQFFT